MKGGADQLLTAPFSYSAIYAKCRAMSAKMLTPDQYRTLCDMTNLSEIASFLVENTSYSKELSHIDLTNIHRSSLENLLRKNLYNTYLQLYKFTEGELKEFLSEMMKEFNVGYILNKALTLMAEENPSVLGIDAFEGFTAFPNLKLIDETSSMTELANALIGSEYYKAVASAMTMPNFNFSILETSLYNAHYERIYKKFKESKNGDIVNIIETLVELKNLATILRFKVNFNLPPEKIYAHIIIVDTSRKRTDYLALCRMSVHEYMQYLRGTNYNKGLSVDMHISTADYINRLLYQMYRDLFRMNTPSIKIPYAFLKLKKIEMDNLIHIIEGIRYHIPSNEIAESIVGL